MEIANEMKKIESMAPEWDNEQKALVEQIDELKAECSVLQGQIAEKNK